MRDIWCASGTPHAAASFKMQGSLIPDDPAFAWIMAIESPSMICTLRLSFAVQYNPTSQNCNQRLPYARARHEHVSAGQGAQSLRVILNILRLYCLIYLSRWQGTSRNANGSRLDTDVALASLMFERKLKSQTLSNTCKAKCL